MKKLPDSPPVYKPPVERWYMGHVPAKKPNGDFDFSRSAVNKTTCAMKCVLWDAYKLSIPSKTTVVTQDVFDSTKFLIEAYGDELIFKWSELISRFGIDPLISPENFFTLSLKRMYFK